MDSQEKPLIMILVKRAAIFMFVICSVSTFYWVVGSESSFLDDTESLLVSIMRISALGILSASGIGILLAAGFALAGRYGFRVLGALGYAVAAALGGLALIVAQTVSILSRGLP
jgi:hypothetical protein